MVRSRLSSDDVRYLAQLVQARRGDGWTSQDIVPEIAREGDITRLWAWRIVKGWRRVELVERLQQVGDSGVDESAICHHEVGDRRPGPRRIELLSRVYGTNAVQLGYYGDYTDDSREQNSALVAPVAPLRGWPSADPADPHGPPFDPAASGLLGDDVLAMYEALTSGSSTGMLDWLEASVDYYARRWETLETGPATLPVWQEHYRRIGLALRHPQPSSIRRRLSRLSAQVGGQLHRLAWSQGNPRLADLLMQTAMVAAADAGDKPLAAWLLAGHAAGVASQYAWGHAHALASRGRRHTGRGDHAATAMLQATSAKASAALNDSSATRRSMRQAERAYERAGGERRTSPLAFSDPMLTFYLAHCFLCVGDARTAQRYDDYWLRQWGDQDGVMAAMLHLDLACIHIQQGEWEHGCHRIGVILQDAPTDRTRWVVLRARQLCDTDLAPYRGHQAVRELRELIAATSSKTPSVNVLDPPTWLHRAHGQ